MELTDLNFIQLLPAFMKDDEANIGLSNAMDRLACDIAEKTISASTWDKLDMLSAEELDLLAEELNISWYDKSAATEVKRQIIKDSDLVHAKLGTNWAALRVIETYFGEGAIIDWFDYDGEPYHFKIQTINQSIMNEKAAAFLKILNQVKRETAILDSIELIAEGICNVNMVVKGVQSDIVATMVRR